MTHLLVLSPVGGVIACINAQYSYCGPMILIDSDWTYYLGQVTCPDCRAWALDEPPSRRAH